MVQYSVPLKESVPVHSKKREEGTAAACQNLCTTTHHHPISSKKGTFANVRVNLNSYFSNKLLLNCSTVFVPIPDLWV